MLAQEDSVDSESEEEQSKIYFKSQEMYVKGPMNFLFPQIF